MSSFTTQYTNPFALAEHYIQLTFTASKTLANMAEPFFDDVALSISAFEVDEKQSIWKVDMVTDQPLTDADITHRLSLLAEAAGEAAPSYSVTEVVPEMWQHNLHEFPPIPISRYLIHGSHIKPVRQSATYPICVDAGMAFGSGEHATTEGCLRLFDAYINRRRLAEKSRWHILDMGCGSAILAMAAAKRLRQSTVVGVDIDKVSVRVANENARLNGVSSRVKLFLGNGYPSRAVVQRAPYDIIFANILAKPLMRMADDLSGALDIGGVAILSGLLQTQESMVLAAHRMVGLHLSQRWHKDGWSALLLEKQ